MDTATLTSKGQLTLPKRLREMWRLGPGDRLRFELGDDRQVTLVPEKLDVRALRGCLPAKGSAVSLDDMDEAIADAAVDRNLP